MNKNLNERPTVLIVGAGLGGLALAQGLANSGFNVSVFERDQSPTSRTQGYRISIRSIGMAALSALLSSEHMSRLSAAKIANVGDGFTIANDKMEPLFKVPQGHDAAIQFLRSELRKVLSERIEVEWDKHVIRLEEKDDKVILHFADGSKSEGDFVVGCDGAGSTLRELLASLYSSIPKVIFSSRAVFGGQVDRTPEWDALLPLNQSGLVRFVGANSMVMAVSFSERADRSPTVFWVLSEEIVDRNNPWYHFDQSLECRQRLLDHCKEVISSGTWHANLQTLVNRTPAEEMMAPWLLRTTRFPDQDKYPMVPSGRITLLGDAAHAMPPDRGLGGNNVLEDARLLSSLLSSAQGPVDWSQLTAQYETQMFARAKQAVQESEEASKR